jgi:fatty acid desaturase
MLEDSQAPVSSPSGRKQRLELANDFVLEPQAREAKGSIPPPTPPLTELPADGEAESIGSIPPLDPMIKLGPILAKAHPPSRLIYWTDLLISSAIAWSLGALALQLSIGSLGWLLATGFMGLAMLRATYFIHEISHLPRNAIPGFTIVWHMVIGCHVLIPTLMIGAHKNHHKMSTYGTHMDPEYQPVAKWSRARMALDVLMVAFAPPLLALRWLISPISWLIPPARRFVIAYLSTLAFNPRFKRSAPRGRERREWILQEVVMFFYVSTVITAFVLGWIPLKVLAVYWGAMAFGLMVNEVRTFVGHFYEGDGEPMTADEQMRDTITLDSHILSEIVSPLGDRHHAIHHRYPSLPYHCMPAVHARLMRELPKDSVYFDTMSNGLLSGWARLWRRAGNISKEQ